MSAFASRPAAHRAKFRDGQELPHGLEGSVIADDLSAQDADWEVADVDAVPEPGRLVMLLAGLALLVGGGTEAKVVARSAPDETTNAHPAAFLKPIAPSDAYGVYSSVVGSGCGGITRSRSSGELH